MTAAPREERPPRTSAAASLEGRGAWWALGALSLLGYLALAGLRGWSQPRDVRDFLGVMLALFAVYGVALWLVERRRAAPPSWKEIVLAAIFFRLALVPAGAPDGASGAWRDLTQGTEHASAYGSFMLYDNDVWRYLWDGRVVLGGVDTYRLSPAEIEELADGGDARFEWFEEEAWASLHPRIGYPGYRTIYPPLAQAVFALCAAVAPASVAFFKLLLLLFDVCTCLLLADLARRVRGRPELVLIYAWNPLVIKELIGSAHVDAILIFFLVLSAWLLERGRSRLALAALGGAILIKLTPLLLIPLFWRRTPWRSWWPLPAVGAAAYLPLWGSIPVMTESLQAFARDWGFNAGPWNAFLWASRAAGAEGRGVADALSLALTLGLVARLTAWAGRRGEGA
ncbi:MAG: glycosyltransferase family 87 protein, partial [Acidobacteriota bacterium]